MSRLRANEVLDRAGFGPFLASEGMNLPVGKSITSVSGVTTFNHDTFTTQNINVNRIDISDSAGTLNLFPAGRLGFQDGASAYFGDGDDLRIYHDGTDTYVIESGVGSLNIQASDINIDNSDASKKYIGCYDGGAVELYFNNSKKLETNTTGVAVAGTTTSTGGWAGTTSSADVLGGIVMPFTCGVNGRIGLPPVNATMVFGGSEYTGGGDNPEGVTMPHDGKLYAVTLNAEQAIGNLTLSATVNGTQNTSYQIAFTSPTVSNPSPIETFYGAPLSFSAGDRLNFGVTTITLSQLQVLTLTFFVKFD